MNVVIPLRGVELSLAAAARQAARIVALVLKQQVDGPVKARSKPCREFVEQVGPRIVLDRVDGVEAQSVEMEFLDPIFGVLDEEVAHRARIRAVEPDRVAPGGFMPAGEEIGRIERQKVPLGTEVVVDDVEQDRDPLPVSRLDEGFEILRPAIACIGSVGKRAVIAPVPAAAEIADRHDLDGCNAELSQMSELRCGSRERAFRRKSAEMELVKHDVVPFAARPGFPPAIGAGIDRLARAVDVVGLKPGRRVRNLAPARQREPIARARAKSFHEGFEEAILPRSHGERRVSSLDHEVDLSLGRGPETKAYPVSLERGAVRPFHSRGLSLRGRESTRFNRHLQASGRRAVPEKTVQRPRGPAPAGLRRDRPCAVLG